MERPTQDEPTSDALGMSVKRQLNAVATANNVIENLGFFSPGMLSTIHAAQRVLREKAIEVSSKSRITDFFKY